MGWKLLDDVGVGLEFFQDGDFPHGRGGHSLILVFKFDLFNGDKFIGLCISGLEDHTVGALSQAFALLVPFLMLHVHFSTFERIIMKKIVNLCVNSKVCEMAN
jgi:hypothetical protein